MSLIIDKIVLHAGSMPVNLHFSYGKQTSVRFVIAEVHAAGCIGTGEGLGIDVAAADRMGKRLIGRDAQGLDDLLPDEPSPWQFAASVPREMYSMALFDLNARARNQSICELISPAARSSLPVMPCIFSQVPETAANTAARFASHGYKHFKAKLYGEPRNDASIIHAIREEIGECYLQADLNCAYKDKASATYALQLLHDVGLNVIEDVAELPHEQLAELLDVQDRPKLMIDSVHRGSEKLRKSIETRCAEIVNLHPNCQGTFTDIRNRARAFQEAGFAVAICGTGYTGVGAHAHLQLAAALNDDGQPYGEVGGHRDHGMPVCTATNPLFIEQGIATLPKESGHGGELNRDVLSSVAQTIAIFG